MKLHTILAAFEGCDFAEVDDAAKLEAALHDMVAHAPFTLFGLSVHKFTPQGVTAAAVLGESHIALHTWPEKGSLFVDIASCTTREAALRALEALRRVFPRARVRVREVYFSPAGFESSDLTTHGPTFNPYVCATTEKK